MSQAPAIAVATASAAVVNAAYLTARLRRDWIMFAQARVAWSVRSVQLGPEARSRIIHASVAYVV